MKWLVSFDITSNRRRYRAVKVLKSYAIRVQKSVFEGHFSTSSFEEMKEKLSTVINLKSDSVRFYPLCASCDKGLHIAGQGVRIDQIGYVIV